MTEAHDRSYKHSTPTGQLQEPERCRTWVFVCQCVRQPDSPQAHRRVCLRVLMRSSKWPAEYVGRTGDGHTQRQPSQGANSSIACEFRLFSAFYTELCLRARRCASTPWLTSVWSSMALLLIKRGPTISGWHTLGRSPTLDLAL